MRANGRERRYTIVRLYVRCPHCGGCNYESMVAGATTDVLCIRCERVFYVTVDVLGKVAAISG